jgi:MYXO-CTERM domain-containing protein
MHRRAAFSIALTLATAASLPALADPILPAPSASAIDGTLSTLAQGFQRQQDTFATAENGLSLDVISNPADVATIRAFFAQSADFQTFAGKHPFTVLASFGEWGDEGNFAGIASVGVAARLMVLERDGAPAAEIAAARTAAINAARAWHVYGSIGGPGVVARGVRRTTPLDPTAPPLPGGTPPATTPLKDAQDNPLPMPKNGVWRDPVVPGLSGWIWNDDTSKDQVSGYALAAAWLWDALEGDPAVPTDVTQNLAADLVVFAHALMKVAPEYDIDLCIRDADGRLTQFHDLNPREITPGGVIPARLTLRNGFNAALAMGIIRAAYHVSGDATVGDYYYGDLIGTRDFPSNMVTNAGIIFTGSSTNFSNVNMLAIALATLGRFETDPYVRSQLVATLEHEFWSTGDTHDVSHVQQAWFDVLYGGFVPGVTADVRGRMQTTLSGFQPAPAFERDRINCDDAGVAAGKCTAIDGTTITLDTSSGHGGSLVATAPLSMKIRPDSDFEWRNDPFEVNGTGSSLMDPRGDWLTAYWLGRLLDTDAAKNISPHARPPLPYMLGDAGADAETDASVEAGTSSPSSGKSGGCGCRIEGDGGAAGISGLAGTLLAMALGWRRRRC